jgi:hypothetical protein
MDEEYVGTVVPMGKAWPAHVNCRVTTGTFFYNLDSPNQVQQFKHYKKNKSKLTFIKFLVFLFLMYSSR